MQQLGCSRKGLVPELLGGQALQFNLPPPRVPVDQVGVQVFLEGLEVRPLLPPEELVLDVTEQALGARVVEAVALPGHALGYPGLLEYLAVPLVLVLPAHVAAHDRVLSLGHLGQEHSEHPLLLRHVRMSGDRPRVDLLAPEVVHRRQVGLAPLLLELGDVGAHLLPGPVGLEVAAEHVLERPADDPLVRVVPVVVALPANAAADAHLAHDLQHRLVGDDLAVLRPQAHGDLTVAAAVGGAGEYLRHLAPQLRPGWRLGRSPLVVMVGRRRYPRGRQQVLEPVSLP